ncbi:30S ribosomal protein S11, chloroplastic [Trebouxia sp. C0009 RCD-2024]
MAEQNEKAFQKQLGVNVGFQSKKPGQKKAPGKAGQRYWKNVGLGFKTPKEAIEGTYIDKKCPFTGNISIRGRILSGIVKSTKMNKTIIVRRNYVHYIKKYARPLSKTVRFNVLRVTPKGQKAGKKGFSAF